MVLRMGLMWAQRAGSWVVLWVVLSVTLKVYWSAVSKAGP
jgi:hypothetical protein